MVGEILFWVTNFKQRGPVFSMSRIAFMAQVGTESIHFRSHQGLWCPRPALIHDRLWSATGSGKMWLWAVPILEKLSVSSILRSPKHRKPCVFPRSCCFRSDVAVPILEKPSVSSILGAPKHRKPCVFYTIVLFLKRFWGTPRLGGGTGSRPADPRPDPSTTRRIHDRIHDRSTTRSTTLKTRGRVGA